uniref:Uncharacterized protein n=1 Tax=Rhizophagus irregularis (strain DAOM 181602 / DAOM 197198 / MUCL 43194) TaxID=747089 RepID=U9UNM8_RHIID
MKKLAYIATNMLVKDPDNKEKEASEVLRFANILGQGNFLRVLLIQPATFLCDNIMELNLSFVCLQFHIAKTDETSLLYSVIQKDL